MNRSTLLAALAVLLLAPAAHAAKVSGKAPAGYTLIALAPSGQAATAEVAGGRFAVKVPSAGATLHLMTPTGGYFGPVVLGKKGKRGIVALSKKGGAIGRLKVKTGFATAKAPRKAISTRGAVRLRRGVPLGAGRLGYTPSKASARMAQNGTPQPGGDPDGDAIPSAFDADDNGNGSLDGVDPRTARDAGDGLFSTISSELAGSVNANAGGISAAQVDAFVRANATMNFFVDDGYARGETVSAVNVDCGALSYCRAGAGSATIVPGGNTPDGLAGMAWTSLDADADGLPDVPANPRFGGAAVRSIAIAPNATTAQIGAGDLFQVRYTTSGGTLVAPTALSLLFVTTPALASADGAAITYPAAAGAAGTSSNPIRMTSDRIALRVWRPQRVGIGGEDAFVDMGRLRYGIPVATPDGSRELGCGASAFSGLSPTLGPAGAASDGIYTQLFPLQDSAADGTSGQLEMTFDVGACLRANGIDPSGRKVALPITAVTESRRGGADRTVQTVYVCLPGCTDAGPGAGPGGPTGGPTSPAGGGGAGGGKADLKVMSVVAQADGADCRVTATVQNSGTAVAPATKTRFAGSPAVPVDTPPFEPGETRAVETTLPGACGATTVNVDAENAVDEFSEDNNQGIG